MGTLGVGVAIIVNDVVELVAVVVVVVVVVVIVVVVVDDGLIILVLLAAAANVGIKIFPSWGCCARLRWP